MAHPRMLLRGRKETQEPRTQAQKRHDKYKKKRREYRERLARDAAKSPAESVVDEGSDSPIHRLDAGASSSTDLLLPSQVAESGFTEITFLKQSSFHFNADFPGIPIFLIDFARMTAPMTAVLKILLSSKGYPLHLNRLSTFLLLLSDKKGRQYNADVVLKQSIFRYQSKKTGAIKYLIGNKMLSDTERKVLLSHQTYLLSGKIKTKSPDKLRVVKYFDKVNKIHNPAKGVFSSTVAEALAEYVIVTQMSAFKCKMAEIDHVLDAVVFVMNAIRGVALDEFQNDICTNQISLTPIELVEVIRNIFTAILTQVHEHGYVHRDIKHDNLMIDPATLKVTVIDFGLTKSAAVYDGNITAGTEMYKAPEMCKGLGSDFSTDLYSAAIVALSLLGLNLSLFKNDEELIAFLTDEDLDPQRLRDVGLFSFKPASDLPRANQNELLDLLLKTTSFLKVHRPTSAYIIDQLNYLLDRLRYPASASALSELVKEREVGCLSSVGAWFNRMGLFACDEAYVQRERAATLCKTIDMMQSSSKSK